MNQQVKKFVLSALIFSILVLLASVGRAESVAWHALMAEDPISRQPGCLLESIQQEVDDGQTTTPVKLVYNGGQFLVTTKSNIDLTYPKVGLVVDKEHEFTIDSLVKETVASFETRVDEIKQVFISGKQATISLGFWPTWPQSTTRVVNFSLIGFTSALRRFEKCKALGALPE